MKAKKVGAKKKKPQLKRAEKKPAAEKVKCKKEELTPRFSLETLRHSTSHVMAAAVTRLWPDTKLGVGPAIEEGFYHDLYLSHKIAPEDIPKIEAEMHKIIRENQKFVKTEKPVDETINFLASRDQKFTKELAEDLKKAGEKKVTLYQNGEFINMCKGPHIENTNQIKAFKLLKIAGAYWKGDSKNQQLQRIYGITFPTQKELDNYLGMLKKAELNDHRKIGKDLNLFSFHEEAPASPFWHHNGIIIYNEIINFYREELKKRSYIEIRTPMILNKELWVKSGHWENYKENMFFTKINNKEYAIKPMNCPGGILIYKNKLHSYKEFPLRIAEFGLVYRQELSGVLAGLFRVRCFTQDDAHIFCLPEQVKQEIKEVIKFVQDIYTALGFKDYKVELSTRPEKSIGTEEVWEKATTALTEALEESGLTFQISPGGGAFYGPKIDFHIKDSLGRTWQCGTIQLDFSMPERFDLTYEGQDGKKHIPIMIHRAILGSMERFIAVLIEHYAGKFPAWLSPVQVRLLTVSDKNIVFATEVLERLKSESIRAEVDDKTETINRKVWDAQHDKVYITVTIGDKETKDKTLAIRTRDNKVKFGVSINDFIKELKENIQNKKTE